MNFLLKGCCLENLAACAARVGTMCRYIVGKNMVILYSATQPHLRPATTANNVFGKQRLELEHSTYIDGGFLIAYLFINAHLLFRL